MRKKRISGRRFFIFLFLLACVAAGGCRLFRFLEVKDQLRDFAANFETSDRDGLRLAFRNPVLLADDVSWLMIHSPPRKTPLGGDSELWTYTLVKRYPAKKNETGNFDLPLGMRFVSGKLSEVVFPKSLTKYLNSDVFAKIMNSMGDADVSKLSQTSTGTVRSLRPADIPTSVEAADVLGLPWETASVPEGGTYTYTYRYRLAEKTPEGGYVTFRLVLGFDAGTKKLVSLFLPLRSVKLTMNFDPKAEER